VFLIVAQYDDSRETPGGFEINILDHIFMRNGIKKVIAPVKVKARVR
jgi:hypothetical protein